MVTLKSSRNFTNNLFSSGVINIRNAKIFAFVTRYAEDPILSAARRIEMEHENNVNIYFREIACEYKGQTSESGSCTSGSFGIRVRSCCVSLPEISFSLFWVIFEPTILPH
jgi:hypothetical protein